MEDKTLWYETFDALPDDKLTLQGTSNLGKNHRIGISLLGTDNDFIRRALNGEEISQRELQLYGETTQAGAYAAGFRHDLTDAGMETLYNTPQTKILNDGVAVSSGLFAAFKGDLKFSNRSGSYVKPQRANEFFVAARPAGATNWKFYKVCDSNNQKNYNVDFTVGAYKHFLKSFNKGELSVSSKSYFARKPIAGTDWTRVLKSYQKNIGTMEVRVCNGNIDDIKNELI